MSEFGFQSFPEMKTIATFAAPEDYQIESEVMNAHQKSSIGNALIRTYMERDYIIPEKFEDFVYGGLVRQGQGLLWQLESPTLSGQTSFCSYPHQPYPAERQSQYLPDIRLSGHQRPHDVGNESHRL